MRSTITTTITMTGNIFDVRTKIAEHLGVSADAVLLAQPMPTTVAHAPQRWAVWGGLHAWGRIVLDCTGSRLHTEPGEEWIIEVVQARPAAWPWPPLTEDKVTAVNALDMKHPLSVSGECTRELPWGGQCTGLLSDGTPVCASKFKHDVLLVAAGRKTAAEVVSEWHASVQQWST